MIRFSDLIEHVQALSISVKLPFAMAMGSSNSLPGNTSWLAPLDHYCERVGTAFWAEPLNATSNAAFLLAAGYILLRQRRSGTFDPALLTLAAMAASVGIGSFLFHTLANRWTLIADIVPIALFIYAFIFEGLRRFAGASIWLAGLLTLVIVAATPSMGMALKPVLGASSTYTPGLIATFGLAAVVPLLRKGPAPRLLLAAGAAFLVALAFRMLDSGICETIPSGTHFLWHIFNGVSVGLALLAAQNKWAANRREMPWPHQPA